MIVYTGFKTYESQQTPPHFGSWKKYLYIVTLDLAVDLFIYFDLHPQNMVINLVLIKCHITTRCRFHTSYQENEQVQCIINYDIHVL